ncbi:hypothetical protein [Alloscardovia omnicolens]|uniref:hypothetical protein n=1 Tax=Alloscardovia omnicolens TaxID=419015 RepID=UPI003A766C8C
MKIHGLPKIVQSILVVLMSISLCVGCASRYTLLQQIHLHDYEWSIFLYPWLGYSLFPGDTRGYVAFIRADGSYDLVRHNGMERGLISWLDSGLYYADVSADNWAEKKSSRTQRFKHPDIMDSIVSLEDGITRVSVYNRGATNNGYQETVMISRPDFHEVQDVHTVGFYPLVSACGNDVYGGYADFTAEGQSVLIFDRLVDNGKIRYRNISNNKIPFSEMNFYAQNSPCRDNKIYILTRYDNLDGKDFGYSGVLNDYLKHDELGKVYVDALTTIDVATGNLEQIPLTYPDEYESELDNIMYGPIYDSTSLDDQGNFLWLTYKGDILSTNIHTGVTSIFFSDKSLGRSHASDDVADYDKHFASTASTVTLFDNVVDNDTPHLSIVHITTLDRFSGKILRKATVRGMDARMHRSMIIGNGQTRPQ